MVWYLIVSIPDLLTLTYFYAKFCLNAHNSSSNRNWSNPSTVLYMSKYEIQYFEEVPCLGQNFIIS